MSAEDNATFARSLMESINAHDAERGAALIPDDTEWEEVPTGTRYRGPDGWRENFSFWIGAFPDGRVEITNLVASDTAVVVEYVGRGTNTGPIASPEGEIPPTGRSVEMRFCDVWEFREGRLAGGRSYFDMASLMAQLGLSSEPATAAG